MRLLRTLDAVDRAIVRACMIASVALLALIVVVVGVGVGFRYGLNRPLAWQEEIPKYLMVWMAFLGAPVAWRHGSHIVFDSLRGIVRERLRLVLSITLHLVAAAVLLVFIHFGWIAAMQSRNQVMIMVGGLSMIWLFLAVPVGSAIWLLGVLLSLAKDVRRLVAPAAEAGARPSPRPPRGGATR